MSQRFGFYISKYIIRFGSGDRNVNAFTVSLRGSEEKAARGFASRTGTAFIFNKQQWCCWPGCLATRSQWLMAGPGGVRFPSKLRFFAQTLDLTAVRRKKHKHTHTQTRTHACKACSSLPAMLEYRVDRWSGEQVAAAKQSGEGFLPC